MSERPVIVTDHAVLRWLERVEGLDVEALRRRLVQVAAIGAVHGAVAVVAGGGKLVLRRQEGGSVAVVTTLEPWQHLAGGEVTSGLAVPTLRALAARRPRPRRPRRERGDD